MTGLGIAGASMRQLPEIPLAGGTEPKAPFRRRLGLARSAVAPMLELNSNDDYFEGMLELLLNARQGFQTARRK